MLGPIQFQTGITKKPSWCQSFSQESRIFSLVQSDVRKLEASVECRDKSAHMMKHVVYLEIDMKIKISWHLCDSYQPTFVEDISHLHTM